jgi:lysozyme family protein
MANFDLAVTKTLLREGGSKITRTPGDNGGTTKYGISKRAYPGVDIENLDEEKAKQIYKADYWEKVSGDQIVEQIIAEEIFDTAVNMGVKSAVKLVQLTLNLVPDGSFGPKSLAAVNGVRTVEFLTTFKLIKISRYAAICNSDPTQTKFLLGWINRTLGA